MLLASAHDGAVEFVGDGGNRWPLVYVGDLAELYALALENAPSGVVYNATGPNTERVRDIAAGVAKSLGLAQTKSIPLETARQQLGPFADALCLDQVVSSAKARTQMHWAPSNYTIYEDLGLKP
jgi:nucleoside-diphosphate-sugar epimerase